MSLGKQVMQDWLTAHEIEFPEHALKQDNNPAPKYAVDEMAKAAGMK